MGQVRRAQRADNAVCGPPARPHAPGRESSRETRTGQRVSVSRAARRAPTAAYYYTSMGTREWSRSLDDNEKTRRESDQSVDESAPPRNLIET
jgi:hypothetical protein